MANLKEIGILLGVLAAAGQILVGSLRLTESFRLRHREPGYLVQLGSKKRCPNCGVQLYVPLELAIHKASRCRCPSCDAVLRITRK
jgi:hypothetical protein